MKSLNEAIAAHGFFRGMRPEHLALLAESARAVQFRGGEVIFREGAPANEFYLIEGGNVALETPNGAASRIAVVHHLQAGDVLGWSWLFPPFTWHFQARAIEPTRAIALNGAHLLVVAEQNPAFGYDLMKRVTQVLIQRLQAARRQFSIPRSGQPSAISGQLVGN